MNSDAPEPEGLVHLTRSQGMIERDALIAFLQSKGIEAVSPPRDLSRKISESTIDLSYGGYSAVFEGFAIYVRPEDVETAKKAVSEFEARSRLDPDPKPTDHVHKFFLSCVFTVPFPGFMHVIAVYHLVKALKSGTKFPPLKTFFASLLFLATASLGGAMVNYYFP